MVGGWSASVWCSQDKLPSREKLTPKKNESALSSAWLISTKSGNANRRNSLVKPSHCGQAAVYHGFVNQLVNKRVIRINSIACLFIRLLTSNDLFDGVIGLHSDLYRLRTSGCCLKGRNAFWRPDFSDHATGGDASLFRFVTDIR